MGVTLDPEEQDAFLASSHTGLLTTLRRDGMPVTLPLWFIVMDGSIYCSTPASSQKVVRARHDERCWFLVERGRAWDELAAVGFAGRVSVLAPGTEVEKAHEVLNAKYAETAVRAAGGLEDRSDRTCRQLGQPQGARPTAVTQPGLSGACLTDLSAICCPTYALGVATRAGLSKFVAWGDGSCEAYAVFVASVARRWEEGHGEQRQRTVLAA